MSLKTKERWFIKGEGLFWSGKTLKVEVTRDENLIVKNMVFLSVIEKTRVIKPQLKIIKFKIKTITSSFI